MPTIVRDRGYNVHIWGPPREHGPPHCHVYRAGEFLKVSLEDLEVLEATRNWKGREAVNAVRVVEENIEKLRAAWERIHP